MKIMEKKNEQKIMSRQKSVKKRRMWLLFFLAAAGRHPRALWYSPPLVRSLRGRGE
jgi:hypothetical protein